MSKKCSICKGKPVTLTNLGWYCFICAGELAGQGVTIIDRALAKVAKEAQKQRQQQQGKKKNKNKNKTRLHNNPRPPKPPLVVTTTSKKKKNKKPVRFIVKIEEIETNGVL